MEPAKEVLLDGEQTCCGVEVGSGKELEQQPQEEC